MSWATGINDAGQVVGASTTAGRSESVPDGPQTATLWSPSSRPPTPEEAIGSLIETVNDLVAEGALRTRQANGVLRPLRNALRSLQDGRLAAACSQLYHFELEVTQKMLDGALAADEGLALIDAVRSIRSELGC